MRYGTLAVIGLLLSSSAAQATQTNEARASRASVRSFTGMYVPLGAQSRDFKSARTFGIQTAFEVAPFVRLLASTSWTAGESKNVVMKLFPKSRIWQYDAGAELLSPTWTTRMFDLTPFVGVGAGARNYYYPDKGMMSRVYPAAYYALGTDLQSGRVGLRVEGRAYLSMFHSPLEPDVFYRDDMVVTFGLTYYAF